MPILDSQSADQYGYNNFRGQVGRNFKDPEQDQDAATKTYVDSAVAGGGDMDTATYDPATIAEQLVGLTASQTLTNKTLTSPLINDTWGGWVSANETWTYASADDPTYTFTIAADKTTKYSAGMRIRVSQSTGGTKYFIITNVAEAGGTTTITVYGGTDYNLENEAISSPYYSVHKAPFGFPLSPALWTAETVSTSRDQQASPSASTWYNVGGRSLSVPIGAWTIGYNAMLMCQKTGTAVSANATLSTANNSESDADLSTGGYVSNVGNFTYGIWPVFTTKQLVLASKTTYYLNALTSQSSVTNLGFTGDIAQTRIFYMCAYL